MRAAQASALRLQELTLQLLTLGRNAPGNAGADSPSTVAISSARPGEGKSFISAALARAAAALGLRVLLIDANLEHPALHSALNCKNSDGLSDALLAQDPRAAVPQLTEEPLISLLPAGTHARPGLLLRKGVLNWLLEPLQPFDWIVLDCGTLEHGGAHLFQESTGGVLIVDASTTRAAVERGAHARVQVPPHKLYGTVRYKRQLCIPDFLYRRL